MDAGRGATARLRSTRARGTAAALALAVAVATAALPPAAAAAPAPASAAARDEIRVLLRRGDRKGALDRARAAVAEDGGDVEAHVLYQEAARGQIPLPIVVEEYRSAQRASPGDATNYLLARLLPPAEAEPLLREFTGKGAAGYWSQVGLAALLARGGKGAEAEGLALAAMATRPGDADAASRAGALCNEARRHAAAETCYRRSLEIRPGHDGTLLGLAHALLRQGKVADARKTLDSIPRRAAPAPPDVRIPLAYAAVAAEERDGAAEEKALMEALAIDARDVETSMALALLRARRTVATAAAEGRATKPEDFVDSLASLRAALASDPERADFHYALGHVLEAAGTTDEAVASYAEAARLDPLSSAALTSLGAVHLRRGDLDDALRELKRALDRDPRDPEALLAMAQTLERLDRGKEALDVLQRLVRASPQEARGWHALGIAADGAGRAAESLAALKKATELAPAVARFHRDYGEALFGAKKYDLAAESLERAVAGDPKDARALTALGRCRTQQKKYDRAAEAYERVVVLRPEDQNLRLLLGALYQEFLHNPEKALVHYHRFKALGGEEGAVDDWIAECEDEVTKKRK